MNQTAEDFQVTDLRLDYQASPEIHAVIASITRTEDVRLSPDNRRLVVVDFTNNRIYLFTLRIDPDTEPPRVEFLEACILTSDSFKQPHGVAFPDNDNLMVCNRAGDVCLYTLPPVGALPPEACLQPLATISGKGLLRARVKTPGSLDVHALDDGRYRVMVCNNHWHFISAHTIGTGKRPRISHEGILVQAGLKVPDGISISPDQAWIAISNHVDGEVLLYRNTPDLNATTAPAAVLKGMVCPHGVRFDGNDRIIAADASSQYLHVYASHGGAWRAGQYPERSIRLLDDQTFYDGRYDTREGGIKGLDIDASGRVLVTTHRCEVLGFYDLRRILHRQDAVDAAEMAALCQRRDQSIKQRKSALLARRWTVRDRATQSLADWRRQRRVYEARVRTALKMRQLDWRNRWSSESLLDPAGPVVSLTTHSHRLETVYYTIESIAMGARRPGRIILWLTSDKAYANLPATLRRLRSRGLEIRLTEDLGPHTKYYPCLDGGHAAGLPLVTADDDIIYPDFWLEQLIEAHAAAPSVIHGFRAKRIAVQDGRLAPYNEWLMCNDRQASHLNFITGVGGVIYPAAYLDYLQRQGLAFRQCCPYADDIWLNVNALRAGFKVAQISEYPYRLRHIPGSQDTRLYHRNVQLGQNQVQLRKTYSQADLSVLRLCAEVAGTSP